MMAAMRFRGGAAYLDLGENFGTCLFITVPPGIKISPGSKIWRVDPMFRGMTIEELIASVERAEKHARDGREVKADLDYPVRRMEMQEFVEVA